MSGKGDAPRCRKEAGLTEEAPALRKSCQTEVFPRLATMRLGQAEAVLLWGAGWSSEFPGGVQERGFL